MIFIENSKICMSCINDLRIWKNTFLLNLRDQGSGFRFSFKLLSSSQSSLILMQNLVSKDRVLYYTSLLRSFAPPCKMSTFFPNKIFQFLSKNPSLGPCELPQKLVSISSTVFTFIWYKQTQTYTDTFLRIFSGIYRFFT